MKAKEPSGLQYVRYEKHNHIVSVTLARPEKLNTLRPQSLEELYQCWWTFKHDEDAWVAVLRGEGRAFCAGFDLTTGILEDHLNVRPHGVLYGDLDWIEKPVIAAIHGFAVGGGATLALGADIRVCAEDMQLGYSQPRVGVLSVGGPFRLPKLIPGLARWYLYSGELIGAQEAHRLGLVVRVVPLGEVWDAAKRLAEQLCEMSQASLRTTKQLVAVAAHTSMYEGYRLARHIANEFFASEEYRESLRAFVEKRKPAWATYRRNEKPS